ncbi:hypothetical protein [Sodalis ligni]|uniref:hypothetical protein n=1 Tax=Sodalis ligni TaxID=2697027 RepID=UPI001FB5BACC|nr:hypothetical protein [Sodalis ligni]
MVKNGISKCPDKDGGARSGSALRQYLSPLINGQNGVAIEFNGILACSPITCAGCSIGVVFYLGVFLQGDNGTGVKANGA